MKKNRTGFTLVEIMVVVMIIGILSAIAFPGFQKARDATQENTCINNMRQIEAAKDQYATEQGLAFGQAVGGIESYIRGNAVPTCPVGDTTYILNAVGSDVTCPNGHVLPP